jgi:spore maturation protein CgeB
MSKFKIPQKVYIVRSNLKVQAAESHISTGLMKGFLDLEIKCCIVDRLDLINEEEKDILVIDDLSNYRSEENIEKAYSLSKNGVIIALWVHWPILKNSKYFDLQESLIVKHLDIFKILYGEREVKSMHDFQNFTNRKYYKIPNASPPLPHNKTLSDVNFCNKNSFDVVFIGSKMKTKYFLFNKVLPLLRKTHPKIKIGLFGRGFNRRVRIANGIIKLSNKYIEPLSSKLNNFINQRMNKINQVISSEREYCIYSNSKICINYHEDTPQHTIYNLRYFKIPFYGGFQIVDSPLPQSPYFDNDEVIHINSNNENKWVEKINYYLSNPLERYKVQLKGQKRARRDHSYKERSKIFLDLYSDLF